MRLEVEAHQRLALGRPVAVTGQARGAARRDCSLSRRAALDLGSGFDGGRRGTGASLHIRSDRAAGSCASRCDRRHPVRGSPGRTAAARSARRRSPVPRYQSSTAAAGQQAPIARGARLAATLTGLLPQRSHQPLQAITERVLAEVLEPGLGPGSAISCMPTTGRSFRSHAARPRRRYPEFRATRWCGTGQPRSIAHPIASTEFSGTRMSSI